MCATASASRSIRQDSPQGTGECRLRLTWSLAAWDDYEYWQGQDRKTLRRLNTLIRDCLRHPFEGIGKPEPLRENLAGFWSRRIDDTHRLVYCVEDEALIVVACRYHYD